MWTNQKQVVNSICRVKLKVKASNTFEIATKISTGEYRLCYKESKHKIWAIYAKITDRDGTEIKDYVYCKHCQRIFRFYRQSKSNLVKHKCYLLRSDLETETQTNTADKIETAETSQTVEETEIVENIATVEKEETIILVNEDEVDNVTKLLTKWIINDCQPYNLAQSKDFLAILRQVARLAIKYGADLDVEKLLPTVPVLRQNLSAVYKQSFEKVKSEIASIKEDGFGLTTDIWTDSLSKQNYIALTLHYAQNNKVKFRLLGVRAVEGEKTKGDNISAKVEEILKDFDCQLSSKTIIVTEADIFSTETDTKRLPCISQLLNSALLKSMAEVDEVAEILKTCLKLLAYLRTQDQISTLDGLFQNFCASRWISLYKMLTSMESKWNEIVQILEFRGESELVSHINIHHLKAMIKTLKPFEEAIGILEDDSAATIHLVLVYLHELKKSCDTNDSEFRDFDFIESLKENLYLKIQKLVKEDITVIHKLALFLYPPTNKLLQFSDKDKQSVDEECVRLMKCFTTVSQTQIKEEIQAPVTPLSKRRKLFTDFVVNEANCDPHEIIMQEIQYYKNTRVVNNSDFDLFGWWELQKHNFPLLYKVSCTVLATPATSAASKRIFLSASRLLSNQDTKETEMEKIMFISSNSKHDELESYLSVRNDV